MATAAEKLKQEVDAVVGIKKVYTKRFYILDVNRLEEIAAEAGTDINKLMDLAFRKLISEYDDKKKEETC